ncbi:MAG: hypothetical protein VR68_11920 [Peptococcaceae bacterium BRH_c4a]|nr:MAG: hypothetical protein VR68_11920 [Peptococcaceae bacterium BRH_c4a]
MDDNGVGKRIKEEIKERGTTQKEVAKDARISRSYLHGIKAGIFDPSVKTVVRIANALRTSFDYLRWGKK